MNLREHIQSSGTSVQAYSLKIGVAMRTVRRYLLPASDPKAQIPHRTIMRRIFIESGGRVRPDDFYDLPDLSTLPAEEAA
jgi:hypothetical protein